MLLQLYLRPEIRLNDYCVDSYKVISSVRFKLVHVESVLSFIIGMNTDHSVILVKLEIFVRFRLSLINVYSEISR